MLVFGKDSRETTSIPGMQIRIDEFQCSISKAWNRKVFRSWVFESLDKIVSARTRDSFTSLLCFSEVCSAIAQELYNLNFSSA